MVVHPSQGRCRCIRLHIGRAKGQSIQQRAISDPRGEGLGLGGSHCQGIAQNGGADVRFHLSAEPVQPSAVAVRADGIADDDRQGLVIPEAFACRSICDVDRAGLENFPCPSRDDMLSGVWADLAAEYAGSYPPSRAASLIHRPPVCASGHAWSSRLMLYLHLMSSTPTDEHYLLSGAERPMRVPDSIRKIVGFAAYESGSGPRLCGTVFVVGLPLTPDRSARFAVTAAHILDEVARRSVDAKLHLRFGRRGGEFVWVETNLIDWLRHPHDTAVDCAAIQLPLPETADVNPYRFAGGDEDWLSEETARRLGVGVGDEVFFPGLFTEHAGNDQNRPIIRTGSIAAMPTPMVAGGIGPMTAYLVEARSIGGLSGSPVFVQVPHRVTWKTDSSEDEPHRVLPFNFFMGLMHGHWDVRPMPDNIMDTGLNAQLVNMGIGIVVPAQDVMAVLRQPRIEQILIELRTTDTNGPKATLD